MNDDTNTAANDQVASTTADTAQAAPGAGTAASNPPAAEQGTGILGSIETKIEAVAGEVKEFFGAHPTLAEARAMFLENAGLSSVVTADGKLFRDGHIEPAEPVA